jgi:hypothetical protein
VYSIPSTAGRARAKAKTILKSLGTGSSKVHQLTNNFNLNADSGAVYGHGAGGLVNFSPRERPVGRPPHEVRRYYASFTYQDTPRRVVTKAA